MDGDDVFTGAHSWADVMYGEASREKGQAMTIPEVRKRLTEITAELSYLTEELKRRPTVRRAAPQSARPQTAEILFYVAHHPDEPLQDVATRFGVNIGRISEALRGKRT